LNFKRVELSRLRKRVTDERPAALPQAAKHVETMVHQPHLNADNLLETLNLRAAAP
jgi:hypothetical protein